MSRGTVHRVLIYLLFGLSGGAALIYEVLWTKHLSLSLGTTIIAASIVAATFMGGLALGSYLLGRFADQETNLLRTYAWLEFGIAFFGLTFKPMLGIFSSLHLKAEHLVHGVPVLPDLLHIGLSAIMLLPPTLLMGGTFPLMCRYFSREKCGGEIGRLYALNTLGATAGCFLAGYLLIPNLGLSMTAAIAIGINLIVGVSSLLLSRAAHAPTPDDLSSHHRPAEPIIFRDHWPVLVSIGVIGFCSLAYEILWTRVFLLFLGNTIYAFSLMLSAFLIGIALGGAVYARLVHEGLNETKLFTRLATLMACSVALTVPFYDRLAYLFLEAHRVSGERWWHLTMLSFFIVSCIMLLPTIVSGSLLPAAVAMLNPGRTRTGQGVGLVVLSNTAGSMLGSLVAGFVLIPLFGTQRSFSVLVGINLLLALFLLLRYRDRSAPSKVALALGSLTVCALVFTPAWNSHLMNSGVYIYAPKYLQEGGLDAVLEHETILATYDGTETSVAIHESADKTVRFFTVNGKTDGGTGRDMATQLLVGHLPFLLHPDPKDALVIGLGTGITLNGLAAYGSDRIDVVEISPEVVEASRWFTPYVDEGFRKPFELYVEDGRNLLQSRPDKFDIILSEPSNPWQSGNANLFTRDFYQLAASRLKPGGTFTQWIGIYDMTPENLKITLSTLQSVFPESLAFQTGTDLVVVCSKERVAFDYPRLSSLFSIPALREVFATINLHEPGDLLAKHYLCSDDSLRNLSVSTINTDDHPVLEFSWKELLGEKNLGTLQMANMKVLLDSIRTLSIPIGYLGKTQQEQATALRHIASRYRAFGKTSIATAIFSRADKIENEG